MKRKLRIGYFADGPWAHSAFSLINSNKLFEIVFICTRYDRKDETLIQHAQENGIDHLSHKNINDEQFLNKLLEYKPDILVSMSFNQIFRKSIIESTPHGIINCHAGKLPFYRGRNILNWALINDEKEFGITVHFVDEGIDTGDIILQNFFPIGEDDTYETLLKVAYSECGILLNNALEKIFSGSVSRVVQSTIHPIGTYFGMRREGDEVLKWDQNSRDIYNFVRAICNPGPMARTLLNGVEMKINKIRLVSNAIEYKCTPGLITGKTESGFFVKTKDTIVEVCEYEFDGRIKVGDRLQ